MKPIIIRDLPKASRSKYFAILTRIIDTNKPVYIIDLAHQLNKPVRLVMPSIEKFIKKYFVNVEIQKTKTNKIRIFTKSV